MQFQPDPLINAHCRHVLHIAGTRAEGKAIEGMQRAPMLVHRVGALVLPGSIKTACDEKQKSQRRKPAQAWSVIPILLAMVAICSAHECMFRLERFSVYKPHDGEKLLRSRHDDVVLQTFESSPWLAERPCGVRVMLAGWRVEQHKSHFANMGRFFECCGGAAHRDSRSLIYGISVGSSRDRGKCDGRKLQLIRNADGLAMAARQRLRFAAVTTAPDRADGVNDVLRAQPPSRGGYCLSRGKPSDARDNLFTGFQNLRASGAMDCAVHASATEQRRVGGVHNGVGLLARDVARARYHQDALTQRDSQNLRRAVHAGLMIARSM